MRVAAIKHKHWAPLSVHNKFNYHKLNLLNAKKPSGDKTQLFIGAAKCETRQMWLKNAVNTKETRCPENCLKTETNATRHPKAATCLKSSSVVGAGPTVHI